MSSEYTPAATWRATVTLPSDGDNRNAASLNAANEDNADRSQYLYAALFTSYPAGQTVTFEGGWTSRVADSPRRVVFNGATGALTINDGGRIDFAAGSALGLGGTAAISGLTTISSGGEVRCLSGGLFTLNTGALTAGKMQRAFDIGPDSAWSIDARAYETILVPEVSDNRTYMLGDGTHAPRHGERLQFVTTTAASTSKNVAFAAATGTGSVIMPEYKSGYAPYIRRAAGYMTSCAFVYSDGGTGHPAQGWYLTDIVWFET